MQQFSDLRRHHEEFIDIEEEIEIDVTDDDKFIDIDANDSEENEEDIKVQADETANETGSKLASQSFDSIEKQTLESYNTLSDEEDRKTFQDYLVTNLKLYFDKWERELGEVVEPTTEEYEDEKDEVESEENAAEAAAEEGGESEEELDIDI